MLDLADSDEAKATLEQFLVRSRHEARRCVPGAALEGRGPGAEGIAQALVSTDAFASHVPAFATAKQHYGGAGAVYVLLKRA